MVKKIKNFISDFPSRISAWVATFLIVAGFLFLSSPLQALASTYALSSPTSYNLDDVGSGSFTVNAYQVTGVPAGTYNQLVWYAGGASSVSDSRPANDTISINGVSNVLYISEFQWSGVTADTVLSSGWVTSCMSTYNTSTSTYTYGGSLILSGGETLNVGNTSGSGISATITHNPAKYGPFGDNGSSRKPNMYLGYNATCNTPSIPPTTSITIDSPVDTTTLSDFPAWVVSWSGVVSPSGTTQTALHYSTDATLLATCEDFPSVSGYATCINGNPHIYVDYGASFTGTGYSSVPIVKNTALVVGTTYYAQLVLQEDDPNGVLIDSSPIISFEIGVPTTGGLGLTSCTTFDIFCHLKNFGTWAFIPTPASLNQFSALTLENSLPFSYLYDIGNIYDELFGVCVTGCQSITVTSGTTAMGSVTFISASMLSSVPFASTLKTILGYLMYFFTAILIYRILIKSHSSMH